MTALPVAELPHAPAGLVRVLEHESARVVRVTEHASRYHVRLCSPSGPMFGWYSTDERGVEVLRHEIRVRERVGDHGLLRAPRVRAFGPDWRIEPMIESDPVTGPAAMARVVGAGLAIAELERPGRVEARRSERMVRARRRAWRAARLGLSPLPLRDWLQARSALLECELSRVTSHGGYQLAHVFLAHDAVYVIDWEELGSHPLGWDLMQFWASLPDADDRALLFELALEALGRSATEALLQLRYAALVARIVSKLAEDAQFGDRDAGEARTLLALLPDVRRAAGGAR